MFTCQVWARHERDEEPVPRLSVPVSSDVHARNGGPDILTTVGVLAAIGRAHQASSVYVPPSEVFIGVLASIYTDAPRPIVMFDVAALYHEFVDDAVERRLRIGQAVMFAGAELPKAVAVKTSAWCDGSWKAG